MKSLKRIAILAGMMCLFCLVAFADATTVVNAGNAVNGADSLSLSDFITQIFAAAQNLGGVSWMLKVAFGVMVLVGALKMTALAPFWEKLGAFKAWAAPVLGMILGVLLLGAGGKLTLAGIFAYIGSGAGAVFLHQFIKTIKAIPGIGPIFTGILDAIEGTLPEKLAKPRTLITK